MRIVSWNCGGALRNKISRIDQLSADILIIQECEDPQLKSKNYIDWAGDYLWTGKSRHKGIGIFSRSGVKLEKLDWYGSFSVKGFRKQHPAHNWNTEDLELFLPFRVEDEFNIIAVWTKSAAVYKYIGQLWRYIQIHHEQITSAPTLIIGDLNSNKIWDQEGRWWNHSDVVSELADDGIISLYHHYYKEEQGKETRPTFYLHRSKGKPYHIDYAFASREFQNNSKVVIGSMEDWIDVSDHMPLILDI